MSQDKYYGTNNLSIKELSKELDIINIKEKERKYVARAILGIIQGSSNEFTALENVSDFCRKLLSEVK